jgi:hypothetical protein
LLGVDAKVSHRVDHFFIELCTAIEDQATGLRVEWECLAQLLNDTRTGRMPGHIGVKNAQPIMGNNEKAVENTIGERRHSVEVQCSNFFAMIVQKNVPSL